MITHTDMHTLPGCENVFVLFCLHLGTGEKRHGDDDVVQAVQSLTLWSVDRTLR